MYRHWRNQFAQSKTYDVTTDFTSKNVLFEDDGKIFDNDGGWPLDTIQRAFNGSVCSEEEFPTSKKFLELIKHHKKIAFEVILREVEKHLKEGSKTAVDWATAGVSKSAPNYYCDKLDATAMCMIKSADLLQSKTKEKGVVAFSKNKDLISCFSKGLTATEEMNPSEERRVELLNKGIPFICSGNFKFSSGNSGSHASVAIGYNYDSKKNEVSFLYRDPNDGGVITSWSSGTCAKITIIE